MRQFKQLGLLGISAAFVLLFLSKLRRFSE